MEGCLFLYSLSPGSTCKRYRERTQLLQLLAIPVAIAFPFGLLVCGGLQQQMEVRDIVRRCRGVRECGAHGDESVAVHLR